MAVVVAYYIIVGAWMIVGFLANICIIFVLAKDREGRKVINLFMGSIAISDMLLAGLVLPEQLHDVSHADDYFERTWHHNTCKSVITFDLCLENRILPCAKSLIYIIKV